MSIVTKRVMPLSASAWTCRDVTYRLFYFLFKIKLYTGFSISRNDIDSFVRRHRSRYDTASNMVDLWY